MGNMFDNYPQSDEYIPNNRPKCHKEFKLDIMTGETASHTFEVPFDVNSESFGCVNIEVIYKFGLEVVLLKFINPKDCPVVHRGKWDITFVTCKLNKEETAIFHNSYLDTSVQLKFILSDNSIQYSEIYPVTVVDSLDGSQAPAPHPIVVNGFGWTED